MSLRTTSLEVARIKRDELEKADDLYWSGVSDGSSQRTAEADYEAAKRRAMGLGFAYLTADRLSQVPSLEDIFNRLENVQRGGGHEAPVLLGAHREPGLEVLAAMKFYITRMAVDDVRGMSAAQHASWKKVKRHAAESYVKAVENRPLPEITRADAQIYYDYWQKRMTFTLGKGPVSANFANRNFGNMRKLFKTYAKWLALDVKDPFDGLSFRTRCGNHRTVLPFDADWISNRILTRGALDRLNHEARLIFLALIEMGCRPSEVCNLTAENIRLDDAVPHLAIRFRLDRLIKAEASAREVPLLWPAPSERIHL